MSTKPTSFFANRFVQSILLSNLFLQIGIWVRNYAVLLYVMEMTNNNAFAVSMIAVAEYAPIFIFSFIGGTFADRWRPKRTMVLCDLLSGLSVFAVMGTLVYGSWKAVFFATLVSAILSQFSQPSGMKLFKIHVPGEQMQMGMSMLQTFMALFYIVGPMIGTFAFQSFGINASMAIVGVAFLLSAVTLTSLPKDKQEERVQQTSVGQEMKAGIRYVTGSKFLTRLMLVYVFAGLGVGLVQPMGIFLIVDRLGLPKESLQWMMVTSGIAMTLGAGMAMGLSKKVLTTVLLLVGMLGACATTMAMGFSTLFWLTLVLAFFNGMCMPLINISINTMIMQRTEEAFVGRVNGIMNPLFFAAMTIMMSVTGLLKESTSIVTVYEIAGVLFLIATVMVLPLISKKFATQEAAPSQNL
ncbi:MAG: MFS transporter [Tumebacillaceae bacterium]